jgi:hypothetical protein
MASMRAQVCVKLIQKNEKIRASANKKKIPFGTDKIKNSHYRLKNKNVKRDQKS